MAGGRKDKEKGRPAYRPTEVNEYADLISACSNHDHTFVLHLAKAATASVPQDIELLVLDILHESLLGGTISQMEIAISKPRWWIRRRLITKCGVSPQEMLLVFRGLACKRMQLEHGFTCRQVAREVGVRDERTVSSSMRRISESMRSLGCGDRFDSVEVLTKLLTMQWERVVFARRSGARPKHGRGG